MIQWLQEINTVHKHVILRADLSVPIENGSILNDFALRRSLPTFLKLKSDGAKTLIISHAESKGETSLKLVADYLKQHITLTFLQNYTLESVKEEFSKLQSGEFLFLDNIRNFKEEEYNDEEFAKHLATLGELYVNDAFAVNHRNHASIVGIPKFISSCGGFLLEDEITNLKKVFTPDHPFIFILGGAKFETKLPLIEKFVHIADKVYVVGALANDFLKLKGFDVGKSLVSNKGNHLEIPTNLKIPKDVVVKRVDGTVATLMPQEVTSDDTIVDCGSKTLKEIISEIENARMIVWNGPLGFYEEGFEESSKTLAKAISLSNTFSILGGGDTLSVIRDLDIENKISFVSTGGGAMLEFLDKGTLPGIEALKENRS